VALVHHDLCFGCGQTNLFGLMLEAELRDDGTVAGRFFVKQDHQGPGRVTAHDAVVAAALHEAMALACGPDARATALAVELIGSAAVGTFVDVQASVASQTGQTVSARATASCEGRPIASGHGRYAFAQAQRS
jgi:acyl-coenzyme A thioesterase PaaI-like protein